MRTISLILLSVVGFSVPVLADLTERDVSRAKELAAKQGKLVAFCYQAKLPGGKTDSFEYKRALMTNDDIKKAVPSSKFVVTVNISANDKANDEKLPGFLRDSSRGVAQIIVMNSDCTQVVGWLSANGGVVSDKDVKEFQKKVEEAAQPAPTPPKK